MGNIKSKVTYNRNEMLLANIECLLKKKPEISQIFVIDNHSTDGTRECIGKYIESRTVRCFDTGSNLGDAGGFNYGFRRAAEDDGAEFIWVLDDYCTWLFEVIFAVGKRTDMSELSAFQRRYYGRISEIIFNVWLDHKIRTDEIKKEELMELSCIHMEKINWLKKGSAFLGTKFFGKKYEGSF